MQSITNKRLTHDELSLFLQPTADWGKKHAKSVRVYGGEAEVQLLMNVYVYH